MRLSEISHWLTFSVALPARSPTRAAAFCMARTLAPRTATFCTVRLPPFWRPTTTASMLLP